MPRTNSSTKTHVRALQAALATEGFTANYTQARRIWDCTAAAATGDTPPPAPMDAVEPGALLLRTLRALMLDQRAYVDGGENTSAPPLNSGGSLVTEHMSDLGWKVDGHSTFSYSGERIGYARWDPEAEDVIILFFPTSAFAVASRRAPRLLQNGVTPSDAWQAVWEEGLAAPGVTRRKRHGDLQVTVRMRVGDHQATGVPVLLSTLQGLDEFTASEDLAADGAVASSAWSLVNADAFAWNPMKHGSLLISGGTPTDRNLVQSRLSMELTAADEVEVVRVNGVGNSGFDRALQRHREAVTSGAVSSRPVVVDVVKPLTELPLTYDGATVYHQIKNLASTGAASNTFILARDSNPPAVLENVECALLGPFGHGVAEEMGLYQLPGFNRTTPGTAVVSFRP